MRSMVRITPEAAAMAAKMIAVLSIPPLVVLRGNDEFISDHSAADSSADMAKTRKRRIVPAVMISAYAGRKKRLGLPYSFKSMRRDIAQKGTLATYKKWRKSPARYDYRGIDYGYTNKFYRRGGRGRRPKR